MRLWESSSSSSALQTKIASTIQELKGEHGNPEGSKGGRLCPAKAGRRKSLGETVRY